MIREIFRLLPLLLTILFLSVDLTRPTELAEIMLLLTPFLFLLTTYLFNGKSKTKSTDRSFSTLSLLFLFLLSFFTVSTLFSTNFILSTYSFMRWVAIVTTLIILSKHVGRYTIKVLSTYVQLLSTVYALLFLVSSILSISFPNYLNTIRFVGDHSQLASFLVVAIPLILSNLIANKTNGKQTRFYRIALIINLVALVFTLARGAWLALTFVPVLLLIVDKKRTVHLLKYRFIIVLTSLVVAIVIFFGLSNDFKSSNNISDVDRSLLNLQQQSLNFKTRLSYFSKAIFEFNQKPLWGTGLNTYTNGGGKINPPNGISRYTHNILLQILTETGIFSTIIFVLILTHITHQLFKTTKSYLNSTNMGVFLAFTISLIYSLYDFNMNLSLIFLVAFSLSISIISSSKERKRSLSKKMSVFATGLLSLYLIVLSVFVVAGMLSTIYSEKSKRYVVEADYQKAGELYLNNIMIFPFSNDYYKEAINYFDNYLPETSDMIIKRWIRYNENDGNMYDFLANRSLNERDYATALEYLNLWLEAKYEPTPDGKTVKKMLKAINTLDGISFTPDSVKFMILFGDFSFGQPAVYFSWPVVNSYYKTIVSLGWNPNIDLLLVRDKKMILDQAITGYFILDTDIANDSSQMITLLDRLIVIDPSNNKYVKYKEIITELSFIEPSRKTVDQLILEMEKEYSLSTVPTPSSFLLGHLYLAKSRQYQSINDRNVELGYINKAIQVSPLTGSFRLYKTKRLRGLGLLEESEQVLQKCIEVISPECERW